MTREDNGKMDRRNFLKKSTVAAAGLAAGWGTSPLYGARKKRAAGRGRRKVIIIGFDGMDPRLTEEMMNAGLLPNLVALRKEGGYSVLGTSTPPQSPVAWANFITGAGPGTHGIFDFIHRNPEKQVAPFYSAAETIPGEGSWEIGDHRLQLGFWPFNHKPSETLLRRQGVPFWDYLDRKDIPSTFYDLPANYPPSASSRGHHRCLSGMGTPDILGTYGTYQHFSEDGPPVTMDKGGGKSSRIVFENETSSPALKLLGPQNSFLKKPRPASIEFLVHRDKRARGAVIEIQNRRILLKEGQWSRWVKVDFELSMPAFMFDKHLGGICRFYLQEVAPNFRLHVSPINVDPSDPVFQVTEPPGFIKEISNDLGLFYTTGFQEEYKALSNKVFTNAEYATQAGSVLEERLNLLEYATEHYDDGLLFFYFSSTDLQAHMFWWNSKMKHPSRSAEEAGKWFNHLKDIYRKMDGVVGDIMKRYGKDATVIIMSDHGFANFRRQFNLNTWLRQEGYIQPADSTSILKDVDWSRTKAYGLGINGLYLNLRGREKWGIVEPGQEREALLEELISKLEAMRDIDGRKVVRKVHRADKEYSGPATALAPDLIMGWYAGYRASWDTCLGGMSRGVLSDNLNAWSADHCADPLEVPGIVFSNKPIRAGSPSLVDVAPTVLAEFGLETPATMTGKNFFVK